MLKTVLLLVHENNRILEEKKKQNQKNPQTIRQLDKARQQGWSKTSDLPSAICLPVSVPTWRQHQEWIHHAVTCDLLGYSNH